MAPLFAFDLNPLHLMILAAIVFLLFGNRLPSAMRSLGRGVVEFKKGMQGIDDDETGTGTKPAVEHRDAEPRREPETVEKKPNTTG
ncbi:MAG: twin-arginine translocase TatA/TatE family subunit [Planctomycetia bacterium]|nr:twin-arginine translocase TatA/TatE family subunit [Planctomycetia bacterium]